jgi:hypothetical protein
LGTEELRETRNPQVDKRCRGELRPDVHRGDARDRAVLPQVAAVDESGAEVDTFEVWLVGKG